MKEMIMKNSKKIMAGAGLAAAGIMIGVIGFKSGRKKDIDCEAIHIETMECMKAAGEIPDVENMSDKEYIRHLHNIEIIPDEVMNYVENIEQENAILKQEVEELSIDKQELKEHIDFLERDIEDLEAQILGHEK